MMFLNQKWEMHKQTASRKVTTYSTMVSRSAMSPRTMRCIILLCSSSDRFLYDTRGILYLVAGDGSTPWSHAWFSISSKDALRFGSLCNIRVIRLWIKNKSKQKCTHVFKKAAAVGATLERHFLLSGHIDLQKSQSKQCDGKLFSLQDIPNIDERKQFSKTLNIINTAVFIYCT